MFKHIEYRTENGIALEQSGFDFSYDEDNRKIYLTGIGGTIVMNLNRRIARFNDTKIWFFSPAKFDDDNILRINENDIEKIINPLLNKKYYLPSPVKRIVVDAGHGGHDNGAVGLKYKEKDLNLSLSRKIKAALEAKGFEVILSRNEDIFLPLDERSKFAKDQKADLFLCIHHNASGTAPQASGIECFSLPAPGADSSHENGGKATPPLPGNKFDEANINLNYLLQSHLISTVNAVDRGVKFARYRVLVNAPCPAILIEAGFVSNKKEENELNSESRQNKTAEAVAAAVVKFAQNAVIQKLD